MPPRKPPSAGLPSAGLPPPFDRGPGETPDRCDFCAVVAIAELTPEQCRLVAVALDAAIIFGVLEHLQGNTCLGVESLKVLRAMYRDKIERIHARVM